MRTVEYRPGVISCHHNYVSEERYDGMDLLVTRKGAISAGSGEWGIIPGSKGTESYIVRGLGNEKSFNRLWAGADEDPAAQIAYALNTRGQSRRTTEKGERPARSKG